MIAPRRRTEPALPTTRRGPSAPTTTVGAIMLVSRRPGVAGPPATRSYSPSMLFSWMPVPGTITPEPEPVDEESDAALPCCVDGGDVRRPACGRVLRASRQRRLDPAGPPLRAARRRAAAARARRDGAASRTGSSRARASARASPRRARRSPRPCPARRRRTRSRSASPYAIRMPPDDGGGFEITSCPRYATRTGRRQTTR